MGNRFQAGDRIGPYRITAVVVNGYHAVHVRESHPVLLEVWPAEAAAEISAKIAAAVRALGALDHPGIAPIVEYGTLPDDRPWMATERATGLVVHDLLVGRTLRADKVAELVRGVAEVLCYAHSRGVIHGRLRAHAITFTNHDTVSIAEWGAVCETAVRTRQRSVYEPSDPRPSGKSDVFALGVIAFRALTGQFPRGLTMNVPGAPAALAKLIIEMTSPDPATRPTAAEVRDAIAEMLGEEPVPVEVIALDDDDDFEPDTEIMPPPPPVPMRFSRPRWTPATHLAVVPPSPQGSMLPVTLDEDLES